MWESKYGNEPADLKLLVIRFSGKIWMLLLAMVIGAAVCGTGYFVQHVVLAPAPEYVAHSMMYVDFVRGDGKEPKYYTFNTAGWSGFVKTDEILDTAMEQLAQDSAVQQLTEPITKEEMRASVDASVDADYRVVDLLVTSTDPNRAVVIAHAVEQAFLVFGDSMQEIEQVRVMTSADTATRVWVDAATYRAVIWGAILGGLLIFFILLFYVTLDDSVYVPETLRRRYGFPVLVEENLFNDSIAGTDGVEQKFTRIPASQKENIIENPKLLEKADQCDNIVLEIPSGDHNGKIVEETIGQLQQREKKIVGVILTNRDEKLLKAYYGPSFLKKGKQKKD